MRVRLYKTYMFRDKDPVIDQLRTIMNDTKTSNYTVAGASGVSAACLRGWFGGPSSAPAARYGQGRCCRPWLRLSAGEDGAPSRTRATIQEEEEVTCRAPRHLARPVMMFYK